MLKLDPIPDDPIGVYDAIVGKKKPIARRARLQSLKPRIEAAYAAYDRVKPALEQLHADNFSGQKEDLLHCYKGSTNKRASSSPRDKLYIAVRKLAHWCAYCSAYTVATLDHYLPKDSYPEFCILPINLIPSCFGCNSPRDFKDQAGARALIHPYFDPVPPQDRILVAAVRIRQGLPEAAFSVDVSGATDRHFAELYARHFKLLSLQERYHGAAGDALNEMVRTLKVWTRGRGRADVRAGLVEQADADEQALGANHFQAALSRGAAASDEFLEYCLGGGV